MKITHWKQGLADSQIEEQKAEIDELKNEKNKLVNKLESGKEKYSVLFKSELKMNSVNMHAKSIKKKDHIWKRMKDIELLLPVLYRYCTEKFESF